MNARQRAEPMSKEARRAAILEAVIPLILTHGASITTSQIAEAAGIAEGTIFRAFTDKSTLLHEAVKSSFDPGPDIQRIGDIPEHTNLEERLVHAARILEERFDRLHSLVSVIRAIDTAQHKRRQEGMRAAQRANNEMIDSLTHLFTAVEDEMAVPPDRVAALLNIMMFATHIPFVSRDNRVSTTEVVSVLLDGIRV